MDDVRLKDGGVKFLVTLKDPQGNILDVSNASSIQFQYQKPDKVTIVTKSGSLETDGLDGKVHYVTQQDDLDVLGVWRYQIYLTIGGKVLHSTIGQFRVTQILKL